MTLQIGSRRVAPHGYAARRHGDYPRGVVNLEQFMDALGDEDVRALVEAALEEALVEQRRRDLAVDREPSSFLKWTGERLLRRMSSSETWVSTLATTAPVSVLLMLQMMTSSRGANVERECSSLLVALSGRLETDRGCSW